MNTRHWSYYQSSGYLSTYARRQLLVTMPGIYYYAFEAIGRLYCPVTPSSPRLRLRRYVTPFHCRRLLRRLKSGYHIIISPRCLSASAAAYAIAQSSVCRRHASLRFDYSIINTPSITTHCQHVIFTRNIVVNIEEYNSHYHHQSVTIRQTPLPSLNGMPPPTPRHHSHRRISGRIATAGDVASNNRPSITGIRHVTVSTPPRFTTN